MAIKAAIHLYGTSDAGGYIVAVRTGATAGDGNPKAGRSLTETLWIARDAIYDMGLGPRDLVAVHLDVARGAGLKEPHVATVALGDVRYFGDLRFVGSGVLA